eukprot:534626_1
MILNLVSCVSDLCLFLRNQNTNLKWKEVFLHYNPDLIEKCVPVLPAIGYGAQLSFIDGFIGLHIWRLDLEEKQMQRIRSFRYQKKDTRKRDYPAKKKLGLFGKVGSVCSWIWPFIWLCCCSTAILLSVGEVGNWNVITEDEFIQSCIETANVNIEPPTPFVFDLIIWILCGIFACLVLICCSSGVLLSMVCWDYFKCEKYICKCKCTETYCSCWRVLETKLCTGLLIVSFIICGVPTGCFICIFMLAILFGIPAIYMYIFIFMLSVNNALENTVDNMDCLQYVAWKHAYEWALIGGGLSIGFTATMCCGWGSRIVQEILDGRSKYNKINIDEINRLKENDYELDNEMQNTSPLVTGSHSGHYDI